MAKTRMVNTRFWNDSFISGIDPISKLLFIYFITNEHTDICGIYELPLKIIAVETGIDESMLKKMIPRLKPKIHYFNSWVCVSNFPRHQARGHESVKKGIEIGLSKLPPDVLKKAISLGYDKEGGGRGVALGNLDSDLDLDSDLNNSVGLPDAEVEKKEIKKFSFEEELLKLKESTRKDHKIVALYWKKKGWWFDNKDQFNAALRRELRPAGALKGYTGEQILQSMNYCIKKYPNDMWTLETTFKRIQDIVNNKKQYGKNN